MDNTDKKILNILKDDSRFDSKTIANMLNVDEKTVKSKIADLESSGTLVKYTTVINNEIAGNDYVVALIEVKVTPQSTHGFDSIAHEIMRYEQVSSVYLMSGAYDLVVIIEGKSLREVSTFVSENLATMDNIISTATHFILKKYKSEGVVLDNGTPRKREMLI